MDKNELIITKNQSPMSAMQMALNNNVDLEKVEKMIELQQKWDALEAKKAFVKAMTEFKAVPLQILKDKHVKYNTSKGTTEYNHASLGNVTNEINKELAKHGLSAAWETDQDSSGVKVACTITHELGYSESTSLSALEDNSGGKNSIQALGSTVTYLERYTLLAKCGLATHDQDDDGNGNGEPVKYINDKQKSNIIDMIAATESDEKEFLKYLDAESIDLIPEKLYRKAMVALGVKEEQVKIEKEKKKK